MGKSLRVTFKALERAIIREDNYSNQEDTLEKRIISTLNENPFATQKELAEQQYVSASTISKVINKLVAQGKIERNGCNLLGAWVVN